MLTEHRPQGNAIACYIDISNRVKLPHASAPTTTGKRDEHYATGGCLSTLLEPSTAPLERY